MRHVTKYRALMPVQNARKILTQSLQRLGYALLLPVSILPNLTCLTALEPEFCRP